MSCEVSVTGQKRAYYDINPPDPTLENTAVKALEDLTTFRKKKYAKYGCRVISIMNALHLCHKKGFLKLTTTEDTKDRPKPGLKLVSAEFANNTKLSDCNAEMLAILNKACVNLQKAKGDNGVLEKNTETSLRRYGIIPNAKAATRYCWQKCTAFVYDQEEARKGAEIMKNSAQKFSLRKEMLRGTDSSKSIAAHLLVELNH
jgi:hypothetical protein